MTPQNIQFAENKLHELINQGILPPDQDGNFIVTQRLITSMRAAKTKFINQQEIEHAIIIPQGFIDVIIDDNNVNTFMTSIQNEIIALVDLIHQQLNENQQIDIFTAKILALKISLWGGKMSLSGVRNPGPNNHWLVNPNFDWNLYLQLIDSVKNMDFINPGFQFMIETMNHIPKFGPAFLTKHLHFLTHGNAPQQQLPIYDSIIATDWFNIPNVRFTDYLDYFNWVREKSVHFGISNHEFERFLFNHSNN